MKRLIGPLLVAVVMSVLPILPPQAQAQGASNPGCATNFSDVPGGQYFSEAVRWAACNDITLGTGGTTFSPHKAVTRAEFATFMWRYAGEPLAGEHPFVDVPYDVYYTNPVRWMAEKGITIGTGDLSFAPNGLATRGQAATFLWRYAGQPSSFNASFRDVAPAAYYATSVGWMVDEGITTGTSATTFSPNAPLTRAQAVTFLWRLASPEPVPTPTPRPAPTATPAPTPRPAPTAAPTPTSPPAPTATPAPAPTTPPAPTPTSPPAPTATPAPAPTTPPAPTPTSPPAPTATPAPTPRPAPTSTPAPPPTGAQFVETFDGDTGLNRFRSGLYHRDDALVVQNSWPGDHDLNCNSPDTTRTIQRDRPQDFIYLCKNHVMTAIGDTSGYSVGWFAPNQTFSDITEVCWKINLTNLGARQWWKVAVLSANAPDVMSEVGASGLSGIEGSDRAIASWGGVGGWQGKLRIGNERMDYFQMDAGNDKRTRYPACFRDNQNGTLTFTMTGPKDGGAVSEGSFTVPGSFPSGPLKVVFQDHNYTPTKDDNFVGTPIGYTWHWDDIVVR